MSWTIVWLTFRQLFVRARLIAAILFSLIPGLITALFLATNADHAAREAEFVTTLYREIVLGTLLPLVAVVLGTSAFGADVEDGTLVYLLVKPVPRWRVVLSKFFVAAASTAAVMLPGVFLPWLLLGSHAVAGRVVFAVAFAACIASIVYAALFLALGLGSRRALVVGLLYVVVLEFVMSRQVVGLRSLSVREFALTVTEKVAAVNPPFIAGNVSLATVWTMGGIMLVGALIVATRRLRGYELAERL
jgi:ABC-2 type transport system permease protein